MKKIKELLKLNDIKNIIKKTKYKKELYDVLNIYFENSGQYYYSINKEMLVGNKFIYDIKQLSRKHLTEEIFNDLFKTNNIFKSKLKQKPMEYINRYIVEDGEQKIYEESNLYKLNMEKKKEREEKEGTKKERKAKYKEYRDNKRNKIINKVNDYKSLWDNNNLFLSFDIEAFEWKQSKLLEIGISLFNKELNITEQKNIIIKEHLHLENSKFVKSDKYNTPEECDNIEMSISEAGDILKEYINKSDVLIGHSIKSDLKFIKETKMNKPTIDTFDIGLLINNFQSISLEKLTLKSDIECTEYPFHNAANDAFYTLESAKKYFSKD